jgi:hypothetical protein
VTALEQTIILVKAWPQPSQKYGETVCCAGVTPEGEWRRLFPIRFRHLAGDAQFARWDVVEYRPEAPRDDTRRESRRVDEASLHVVRKMPPRAREGFFDPLFRDSVADAAARGESLTLVRPSTMRFRWKAKTEADVEEERQRRTKTMLQGSLFDRELNAIDPCPYDLSLTFEDGAGPHEMTCGDWETAAAFFNLRRAYGDEGALEHLRSTYEERYFNEGVALALGTVKKRPQQWLLLGVIRLDETTQPLLV